ncbi:MAG: glycosyltransferase family 2 protein [Ruminococcaceae bacterium]|nr:glycosyltransferase family 2 protein [Oscillospiraceae bacterium]
MNDLKVSVIIPVYNVEKHLARCIESLINQKFDDYEIIVVNDGSTDNSPQICDEYARKSDLVKVIHKQNGGVSSARNAGIDSAVGEYIMFVDSDDYVTDDYISTMYECQIANPDHLIVCNVFQKTEHEKEYKALFQEMAKDVVKFDKEDYFLLYKTGLSGFPVNKIFKKSILLAYDLRFNTAMTLFEDLVFVAQYYQKCKGSVVISKPLYCYYILDTGAVRKYRKNLFHHYILGFNFRIPLITKDYLTDFCDIYLKLFFHCLKNTFDERNTDSLFKKIKYNNSILKSEEFIFCLEHASKKDESPKYIKMLQRKNYLWIYLREKMKSLVRKR